MEGKYIVICRYETYNSTGKIWGKWYNKRRKPLSKGECLEVIAQLRKEFEYIDRKTKLRHEYSIKPYREYLKELEEIKKIVENAKKKTKRKQLNKALGGTISRTQKKAKGE